MRAVPPKRMMFLLLVLVVAAGALVFSRSLRSRTRAGAPTPAELKRLLAELTALESREQQMAETHWAKDLAAQRGGQRFEAFWDALNASTSRWEVVEAFAVPEIDVPEFLPPLVLPHGIEGRRPAAFPSPLTAEPWLRELRAIRAAGWRILQCEFRHHRCIVDGQGQLRTSTFGFTAHLVNDREPARASLTGDLEVDWGTEATPDGLPAVRRLDASRLTLQTRRGEPVFQRVLDETIAPPEKSHFIDPLMLHDLDGDGRSEIILAARNRVYRWKAWDRFESEPLCRESPGLVFTAVIADFDGDGFDDFLCAKFEGLFLFRGSPRGAFEEAGRPVWSAMPHLKYGQVLTGGDIDGDGDLDVWLGQYKGPYTGGQMPTPYYDANDGNPSYLLLNDGRGSFTDGTEAAGLGPYRWRRSYSGSLVDLDGDGDLDLMVVSDFAGVDVYANDGRGRFTNVTDRWLPERHAFGMAHTFADFDGDGRLDFLVMGMHCPTPQRLDALKLDRPDRPELAAMRSRMAAGSRLYAGQSEGRFQLSALGPSIARTGWSWGCSAFDFDNDGFADVYLANGHESKQSVRDYEPEFWLHDIYVGSSSNNPVVATYFDAKQGQTRGHGQSYGGYEKNRLYWNRGGREFVEIGHLLGVALEQDSRNVVADDLDGDGKVDLLVTTFEAWPQVRQTLQVYRNRLEDRGHWIGVRLSAHGIRTSPVGAVVTLEAGGRRFVRPIVTGDSHRAQHANTAHFGLGQTTQAERLEVRWPNGKTSRIERPRLNIYHLVTPPPGS